MPRLQWSMKQLWLEFLPWSNDEPRGRRAHSCGAATDFHRLPEHPGSFIVLDVDSADGHHVIKQSSMTSTFKMERRGEVKVGKSRLRVNRETNRERDMRVIEGVLFPSSLALVLVTPG